MGCPRNPLRRTMAICEQIESRQSAEVSSWTPDRSVQGNAASPERFVDSVAAAEFLSVSPRRILDMARAGLVPAHPLSIGLRREWRFRLSELERALCDSGASFTAPSERRAKRKRIPLPQRTDDTDGAISAGIITERTAGRWPNLGFEVLPGSAGRRQARRANRLRGNGAQVSE